MNVFQAVKASAIHRAEKSLEWEERGIFGRRVKHYSIIVTLWTRAEAERNTGRSYSTEDDYYRLDFTGDLPPELRQKVEDPMQPYMKGMGLARDAQQFLRSLAHGIANDPIMSSGLMENFYSWNIDTEGWIPL